MAKTKEQLAAEKAAKKQRQADQRAEAMERQALKDTQRLEITALRQEMKKAGASQKEINAAIAAENKANNAEYKAAVATLKPTGRQSLIDGDNNGIYTQASTYDATTGAGLMATQRRDAAQALHDKYYMTDAYSPDKRTLTGIRLSEVDKAIQKKEKTGSYGVSFDEAKKIPGANVRIMGHTANPVNIMQFKKESDPVGATLDRMSFAEENAGGVGNFAAGDVARKMIVSKWVPDKAGPLDAMQGLAPQRNALGAAIPGTGKGHWEYSEVAKPKSIRPVKGYDDVYRVVIGDSRHDDLNYTTEYYKKNADGTYNPILVDRMKYNAPDESGLGGIGSIIGMVVAIANPFALPAIGAAMLGGAVGGGLATGSLEGAIQGGLMSGVGAAAGTLLSGSAGQTLTGADGLTVNVPGTSVPSIGGQLVESLGGSPWSTEALAVQTGLTSAVRSGISAVGNGADFGSALNTALIGALAGGANSYVDSTVTGLTGSTLAGDTAGGAVQGGITAGLNGNDALTGALAGGAAGAVSNVIADVTGSQTAGNVAGGLAGSYVNTALTDSNTSTGAVTAQSGTTTVPPDFSYAWNNGKFRAGYKDLTKSRNIDFTQRKWG